MEIIEFWYWWVLGVVLLGLEILTPGFFFLWLALAAGVTGALLWLWPALSVEWQLLLFSVLSVASFMLWRRYGKTCAEETDHPLLNQRGAQYLGRIVTLTQPIVDGQGRIKVDDSSWKVEGPDCPVGAKIKIVEVKSSVFWVQPLTEADKT